MKNYLRILFCLFFIQVVAQNSSVKGYLQDEKQLPIPFANVIIYSETDNSLVKAGITTEDGLFQLNKIPQGLYYLEFSLLGFANLKLRDVRITKGQELELPTQTLMPSATELDEVTIIASRPIVKVMADRTIFNIEGTVNSVGFDVIALLRKAPAVTVDNNNNISVLGRTGVLVYVDGKRLPLTGDDLSNYLQNISSEQVDRLDIVTNPDVSYDAEGNAGIIDIRLKKDKNLGVNGTLKTTYRQGRYASYTIGASGNYRNKNMNVYTTLGAGEYNSFNESRFDNYQNGLRLLETNNFKVTSQDYNFRVGTDFFLAKEHTLGVLVSGSKGTRNQILPSKIQISTQDMPNQVDSLLVVNGTSDAKNTRQTYNLNYFFETEKGQQMNVDLDYGRYRNKSDRFQPNKYFNNGNELLLEEINQINAPTNIDIYTFRVDYKDNLWGGKLGLGSKVSRIVTDNTYLFFDEESENLIQNDSRSRLFDYTENVFGGYLNYSRDILDDFNFSVGLRVEQTNADGDLQAFIPALNEPPVKLKYTNWFPNFGLIWDANEDNRYSLNYGRRINRPNYFVLNPFTDQITQLSFEKGNPFLRPEIVNNFEAGYSYKLNFNLKVSYSRTNDRITRLVGPDETDPRATFSTYENLGNQTVLGVNSSISLSLNNWLKTYFNFSASYIDNQAEFEDGAVVDLQVFSYKFYSQNTFKLPKGFNAEISGYYNGPRLFGAVFEMEPNWSLDIGLQKRFFDDKFNVRLVATDIFYKSGFEGIANFDGLTYFGSGQRDSRRISVNLSYIFGNQDLKSRKRSQGLESEQKRVD